MKIKNILYFIPLILILIIWEISALNSTKTAFLFSSPNKIFKTLSEKILNGELVNHTLITGFEALVGLVLGGVIGSLIGFVFLYYPKLANLAKYYILAVSSIPIFALAPMMIIWFGTGIKMKIALAFFSTVFVAIFQAYQGGQKIDKRELEFFKLNQASDEQKFWQLTLPSSIDWLIQSLKLNSGLAVLGAFIGEFIASDQGLGYAILKASGLYDVSYVLAGIICIILLTLIFNLLAQLIEKNKLKIIRKIAINRQSTANNI
jgi:NitT/TauT family transport system permease protein